MVEDIWQVMRLLVKVKGQVTVKVLRVALVQVKVFVLEELLLFSLSSRTTPSTRPAGRCWGFWG